MNGKEELKITDLCTAAFHLKQGALGRIQLLGGIVSALKKCQEPLLAKRTQKLISAIEWKTLIATL